MFKTNEITFSLIAESDFHTVMCLQYLPPDVSHFVFNALCIHQHKIAHVIDGHISPRGAYNGKN